MAATAIDTAMLQSDGFQAKRKEDVDNKDNLWYVWSRDVNRGAAKRIRSSFPCVDRAKRGSTMCGRPRNGIPREKNFAYRTRLLTLPLSYASQVVYSGGSAEQRQQQATVE